MQAVRRLMCICVTGMIFSLNPALAAAPRKDTDQWHWVAAWGAAQQVPEPQNELPAEHWRDSSLRQIVHTSLGGKRLRVRISNAFGTEPLQVQGASIARAVALGQSDVTDARRLTFGGRDTVMIPAGAEYYSDALDFEQKAGSDLAVTMYFKEGSGRQTGHPGSRATSFAARGNRVLDAAWPEAVKVVHWYALSDIEVQAPRKQAALSVIGDSITDGYGVATDTSTRWPDFLAQRLAHSGQPMGVVNTGIGGGRMLRDGLGFNLAARFERDVIGRAGISHAIVLIGVNDFGTQRRNGEDSPEARAKLLEDLKMAHRQLVERAHLHGIYVIGATLTPYGGSDYYKPGAANEADRQQLNEWIRTSGVFDAVADFDAALRDPAQPERMRKEVDLDGLHPSIAGYRALADAVPLKALRQCGAAQ
jgi:lysophospholipase L1-like esterase